MDKTRVRGFVDRVFTDMAGAMSAGLVYLGARTGLFGIMNCLWRIPSFVP